MKKKAFSLGKFLVLSTALVTLLGMPTVSMATDTGSASTTNTTIDPEFDVSTGWEILAQESDLKQEVNWAVVFRQNEIRPDGLHYVSTNSANIGTKRGHLRVQRIFHLKAGKEYSIDFLYSLSLNKVVSGCYGYIDFNGDRLDATTTPVDDQHYTKTIVPTADMDYTITLEMNSPRGTNYYLLVGFNPNDPNSGIHEVVDPEPVSEESASTEPSETATTDGSSTTATTTSEETTTSSTAAADNGGASSSNDPDTNGNGAAGTSSSSSSSNYKDPADPADPAKKASLPRTNETNSATISMLGFGCLAVLAATTYWLKKVKKTGNN